jgi:DNA-binding LytR/AlgR family response regulator
MKEFDGDHRIGLVLLSPELEVIGLNPYATRVLGPAFSGLGKSIYDYHPPASHETLRSILRQGRETGREIPIVKIIDVMGKVLVINFGQLEMAPGYQGPIHFMTFIDATSEADARTNPESGLLEFNKFPVMHKNCHIFLDADDIYFCESDGNYCYLITGERSYYIQITLKTILKRYTGVNFFQVHKSYIANLNKIEKLQLEENNKLSIVFSDSAIPDVPVARRRVQALKDALNIQ